ncbi:MAG: DUF192 domain-containing protein [Halodesulfurarchaeum sp.]
MVWGPRPSMDVMTLRRAHLGVVLFAVIVAGIALAFGGPMAGVDAPGATPESQRTSTGDRPATITFVAENGTELGTVHARVADDPMERYTGLSETASLPENAGMLFVYPDDGKRTFVMRNMDFPLDIVFVGSDGQITAIHEAPVENDSNLIGYTGTAKWVLEVNRGYTDAHSIDVGDRVRIQRG